MLFHLVLALHPNVKRKGNAVALALICSTLISSCEALIGSQILSISFHLKTIKKWSPKLGILGKNDHTSDQFFSFSIEPTKNNSLACASSIVSGLKYWRFPFVSTAFKKFIFFPTVD